MSQFDFNRELEIINIQDHLSLLKIKSSNLEPSLIEVEYFYHSHRLGARVPLFLIFNEDESFLIENIRYFCKVGNVISIKNVQYYIDDFISVLCKIFQQYGSNYGILIDFGRVTSKLVRKMTSNMFLKSEITCIVQLSDSIESKDVKSTLPFIYVKKANSPSIQNPIILEVLKEQLYLKCLDWKWQYEQTDELMFSKLAFKNLEKWKGTDPIGKTVGSTRIIPMKLMLDDDKMHSPIEVMKHIKNIGLIIDLSNDRDSYDKQEFTGKGIEHEKIQIESKVIPSSSDIYNFINKVRDFVRRYPDKHILVHCHYGYNRTGLMICAYLIEEHGLSVEEALEAFKEARPPGIKHQNYIDKLYLRYSLEK